MITVIELTVNENTPVAGTTTVTASTTAGPVPDRLFVIVEVTQP